MQKIFLAIGSAMLAACATPVSNYQPVVIAISEPPVGEVQTANVGDELLKQGKYKEHAGIRLNETIKIGVLGSYTFFPGEYLKTGTNKQGSYYLPTGLSGSGKVQSSALSDPFQVILVKPDGETICGVTVFDAYSCDKSDSIQTVTIPILSEDSFQQTLIYSGKVGDVLKIGYREYSGSVARPAFNNDVEYDLNQSKFIAYKGAQIEVLEANNQLIRYKVVRNFNSAQ
jgi:hypothetical protein|tara:strand:+ start:8230 stop:8913 length:684 start_codon:yes stop_codon:yes gene_type:complete